MMGEEKKGGMCNGESCGMGGGYMHMRGFWIVKKVFYLILLIVVFCFGVQLGQLKTLASLVYGSGYRMMGGYDMMYNHMGTSTKGW